MRGNKWEIPENISIFLSSSVVFLWALSVTNHNSITPLNDVAAEKAGRSNLVNQNRRYSWMEIQFVCYRCNIYFFVGTCNFWDVNFSPSIDSLRRFSNFWLNCQIFAHSDLQTFPQAALQGIKLIPQTQTYFVCVLDRCEMCNRLQGWERKILKFMRIYLFTISS